MYKRQIIETPCSRVFHSGDFKIDYSPVLGKPFNKKILSEIGKKGINTLVCDSTNVFNDHHGRSESNLFDNFVNLFKEVKGIVVATTFASNIARLKTLALAADKTGRSLVVLGRAMNNMIKYGKESGILKDFPDILSPRDAKLVPKSHLLVLASGSQGEPRAASAQLAREGYMGFTIGKGDVFLFSSKTIPGNEIRVSYIVDQLERRGVEVIEDKNGLYHVSGHANKPDLNIFHSLISPDLIIPMHGEYRHLKEHERIAKQSGIQTLLVENGDVAQISNSTNAAVIDKVDCGRIFLDGSVLIDEQEGVISERKKLMYNGILNVSAKDKNSGKEQSIVIKASSGLSDEDIEKMVKDAEANAEDDAKFEELVKVKNNADMLCHATRKTVSDSGDKLSDEEKEQIEVAVKGLEDAVKAENVEQIEEATKALNDVLTPLSSKLYNQQQDGQPNTSEGTEDSQSSDDNTVEADFEEVQEEDK